MSQMDTASTNIGGILAAMVHQIEDDNARAGKSSAEKKPDNLFEHSVAQGSMSKIPSGLNSIELPSERANG